MASGQLHLRSADQPFLLILLNETSEQASEDLPVICSWLSVSPALNRLRVTGLREQQLSNNFPSDDSYGSWKTKLMTPLGWRGLNHRLSWLLIWINCYIIIHYPQAPKKRNWIECTVIDSFIAFSRRPPMYVFLSYRHFMLGPSLWTLRCLRWELLPSQQGEHHPKAPSLVPHGRVYAGNMVNKWPSVKCMYCNLRTNSLTKNDWRL